jgi:endonuclease YncB( thermonuclease family)
MSHNLLRTWSLQRRMLLLLWLAVVSVPSASGAPALQGEVVGIADGDTLTLLVDDVQYRIRLAEIDAPEGGQPWGSRARQALADKVFRAQVRIDVVDLDRYGRTVGKVWLEDRDINREMVREGHAWVYRRYLTDPSLIEDETAARSAGSGLWAQSGAIPPWRWRRNGATPVASGDGAGDQSGSDCRIKGNISSSGAKIYHVPGQRYYDNTRIDTGKGERWFCSEAQARLSGWRRAEV